MQDIIFHLLWLLCWFVASVQWAITYNNLKGLITDNMNDVARFQCSSSDGADILDRNNGAALYVQAAIAVVSPLNVHVHVYILYVCCA